ncbi:hypothetical protein [Methylophilus luteus]|uniref:PD-(D/E)XK nuclease superfamily protein n=1 Tax=Methylophilus luteus TaxID=640108 RepID=A0ABW3F2R1_9PROT
MEHISPPPLSDVKNALEMAISRLLQKDHHLLAANASERSLTHWLAIHLMPFFKNYEVDCEYNRDGFDVKKLMLNERPVVDTQLEAVTVFPDIIVHRRGSNNYNLLVVEVKKSKSAEGSGYDLMKLKAFKEELNYTYAAHVILGEQSPGKLIYEINWQ